MSDTPNARRVIQVNRNIIGPVAPKQKTVRPRSVADFPQVAAAHRDLAAKLSNPLLWGPPICDELIAFVQHAFNEEEAEIARHLHGLKGRTARSIARTARRPLDQVESILDHLAFKKRTIVGEGPPEKRRYRLLPVVPGMFEMVLIGESPETLTDWHRRYAELFEALYETGYMLDYHDGSSSAIRFLPVGRAIGLHPMALPSDRLEVVLDRFDSFGLGHCQCRMSTPPLGEGCGRPLEVCTVMGQWAEHGIQAGWLRRVSRDNVLEVKREAESHGLVTWIMNVESAKSQASCSCCGCCCKAMRAVTEFSAPGMAAPPHFMPRFHRDACTACARCAKACPMGAISVDTQQRSLTHQPARCIGCGLCQLACDQKQAISLETVPEYRLPYRSWFSMLLQNAPSYLKATWKVWRTR